MERLLQSKQKVAGLCSKEAKERASLENPAEIGSWMVLPQEVQALASSVVGRVLGCLHCF